MTSLSGSSVGVAKLESRTETGQGLLETATDKWLYYEATVVPDPTGELGIGSQPISNL